MKKFSLLLGLLLIQIICFAQQLFTSTVQSVHNSQGENIDRYKATIEFDEPNKIGGEYGSILITLAEMGNSMYYRLQYLEQTTDGDGKVYWYRIAGGRAELFNIVRFHKFNQPILNKKYSYSFVLAKYDINNVKLYEHTYFCLTAISEK